MADMTSALPPPSHEAPQWCARLHLCEKGSCSGRRIMLGAGLRG